jgi:hypothetical protein
MSTKSTEEIKPEVPMGGLAKDVGLQHESGTDHAPGSFKQAVDKLLERVQRARGKKS